MAIDFLQTMANLLLAMFLLRYTILKLPEDSEVRKALAFIVG